MYSTCLKLLLLTSTAFALVGAAGCQTNKTLSTSFSPQTAMQPTLDDAFLKITNPAECDDLCPAESGITLDSISPNALVDYENISYTPISLGECIERALQDSEVFRELGGTIVRQPGNIDTSLDPALTYLNPTTGEQAALSAFDANVVSSLFFENNDRPFNNRFSGNTEGILVQDLAEYQLEISKRAATGTLFTARQSVIYDNNNQAGNRFEGSFWEAIIDAGFRHPLLQGSGTLFNRIAGPSQTPGQYNGVLIARTNTEISLAEFETSTREFIANVENAYWDLYYAYRELDAQTDARDAAYEVFKRTSAQAGTERISGLEEASAEEQYLRFEVAIIESLEGRTIDGTQTNSGITGGSFRRTIGVRVAERRLRYLIGMPITDGTLLQPNEVPTQAAMVFDWDQSVQTAVSKRPETRRQRWVVKQKELELTAARNFLMPRFDLVGNYRFRGLGKSLTGGGETLRDDINNGTQESGAFSDLAGGDFQEVQLGAELSMPVGYRQANAAVRNAELSVQRARKVLEEQERKILLDLSNAIAETRRAYSAMQVAKKRFNAAVKYREQAAARIDSGRSQMDVLLEAQRRILEAQLQYINAEVEYTQAIKNVHFEKASYLQYHGIALQESLSDPKAYQDAAIRYSKPKRELNYVMRDAAIAQPPINSGAGIMEITGEEVISETLAPLAPMFDPNAEFVPGTMVPNQAPVIEVQTDTPMLMPPTGGTIEAIETPTPGSDPSPEATLDGTSMTPSTLPPVVPGTSSRATSAQPVGPQSAPENMNLTVQPIETPTWTGALTNPSEMPVAPVENPISAEVSSPTPPQALIAEVPDSASAAVLVTDPAKPTGNTTAQPMTEGTPNSTATKTEAETGPKPTETEPAQSSRRRRR